MTRAVCSLTRSRSPQGSEYSAVFAIPSKTEYALIYHTSDASEISGVLGDLKVPLGPTPSYCSNNNIWNQWRAPSLKVVVPERLKSGYFTRAHLVYRILVWLAVRCLPSLAFLKPAKVVTWTTRNSLTKMFSHISLVSRTFLCSDGRLPLQLAHRGLDAQRAEVVQNHEHNNKERLNSILLLWFLLFAFFL